MKEAIQLLFFSALFIILLLGAAGIFYLILEEESAPVPQAAEEQIIFQEEVQSSKPDEEEVIQQAKQAIALAEQVIASAQEYLKQHRQEAREPLNNSMELFNGQNRGGQKYVKEKTKEETDVKKKGDGVKGVYMTGFTAAGQGSAARFLREDIVRMVKETELNAMVIDVKEAEGPYMPPSLIDFVSELKQKNIWTIARIVVFADASLISEKPALYLKTKTATTTQQQKTSQDKLWQDWSKRYWLDPASQEVQEYIIDFSKKVIDAGFDELQFDYLRFPADGPLASIVYPEYDGLVSKNKIIGDFTAELTQELREYNPDIVLSVDLFGLVATKFSLPAIGQDLASIAPHFDYISFMLYPSHFYGGFEVSAITARQLSALSFPYDAPDPLTTVSAHPYEVVHRSLLSVLDYLQNIGAKARLRPWLQDFSLKFDTNRGIVYDAEKVRLQIKAAEDAGASGWLLWNPKNIYTEEALR